jgi:transposase
MPNPQTKYKVRLASDERESLERLSRRPSAGAVAVRRARILLLADEEHLEGRRSDRHIAEVVGLSERQIVRIRQRFVQEGDAALSFAPRPPVAEKLDGDAQAQLATICCSSPPEGRERWTLQLLCDELAKLEVVESISRETVRQALKKTNSSRGGRSVTASRTPTAPASSRRWRKSSTSTEPSTTRKTR